MMMSRETRTNMVLRLNKTDTDFDSDFARLLNMKREQDEDVNLAVNDIINDLSLIHI